MWRALATCGVTAALALGAVLVLRVHPSAVPVLVLAAIAVVSGVVAVVLRFIERPRETAVGGGDCRVDTDWHLPIIH
jgi:hypothetical protein